MEGPQELVPDLAIPRGTRHMHVLHTERSDACTQRGMSSDSFCMRGSYSSRLRAELQRCGAVRA